MGVWPGGTVLELGPRVNAQESPVARGRHGALVKNSGNNLLSRLWALSSAPGA